MLWCIASGHYHDDVIKWKHFPRYWPFVRGNSPVTGEFPSQRPVTRCFDVFFDLRLNKWLNEQSWGWWFEMPSRSLWRHCNGVESRHSINWNDYPLKVCSCLSLCANHSVLGDIKCSILQVNNKLSSKIKLWVYIPWAIIWITDTHLYICTRNEGIVWQDSDHLHEFQATKKLCPIFQQTLPWNPVILYQWSLTNMTLISVIIC